MVFTSVFSQEPIEITYDAAANTLKLSDQGATSVNWVDRKQVTWYSRDQHISKFEIVSKSRNRWDIFKQLRPITNTWWMGNVRNLAHLGDWEYSIIWYRDGVRQPVYDPKIAVKPVGTFLEPALLLALMVTSITSLIFFKRKRSATVELKDMTAKYEEMRSKYEQSLKSNS